LGYFCSETKPIKTRTFEDLAVELGKQFKEKHIDRIGELARQMRESVLELASPAMRQAEQLVLERVKSRRILASEAAFRSPEQELVVTDILVAREIARVDLGIDLLVAQPQ
jgi:hypothetical protein